MGILFEDIQSGERTSSKKYKSGHCFPPPFQAKARLRFSSSACLRRISSSLSLRSASARTCIRLDGGSTHVIETFGNPAEIKRNCFPYFSGDFSVNNWLIVYTNLQNHDFKLGRTQFVCHC